MTSKIMGGVFALETFIPLENTALTLFKQANIWTCNARSALFLLLKQHRFKRIWLPAYLCPSLLKAIPTKTEILFYPIDKTLNIPHDKWMGSIKHDDAILYIDYFGFRPSTHFLQQLKHCPAFIIEDASQAFLSDFIASSSDATLISPRKFVGVPDGGILISKNTDCPILKPPPWDWWSQSFQSCLLRQQFDQRLISQKDWYELFKTSETNQPVGFFAMSELSRQILRYNIDYPTLSQRRRDNYQTLLTTLKNYALYPDLPEGIVPLGFPILLNHRDEIREILIKNQIYPPIHWNLAGIIDPHFKDSHDLSRHSLTLPCDQRYDAQQMDIMAQLVLKYV